MQFRAEDVLSKARRYGAFALIAATLIVWIVHPVPFCIDCEFPNAWGHADNDRNDVVVIAWAAVAAFLGGLLAVRRSWLLPLGIVTAILISQPLGGVAWWSLRENEGPFIVVFGLPALAACLVAGHLVQIAAVFVTGMIGPLARMPGLPFRGCTVIRTCSRAGLQSPH